MALNNMGRCWNCKKDNPNVELCRVALEDQQLIEVTARCLNCNAILKQGLIATNKNSEGMILN